MICHMRGQRLFLSQMRLGLLLSSTDAITSWQKRAGRQQGQEHDLESATEALLGADPAQLQALVAQRRTQKAYPKA
jgi:hypothetical protein